MRSRVPTTLRCTVPHVCDILPFFSSRRSTRMAAKPAPRASKRTVGPDPVADARGAQAAVSRFLQRRQRAAVAFGRAQLFRVAVTPVPARHACLSVLPADHPRACGTGGPACWPSTSPDAVHPPTAGLNRTRPCLLFHVGPGSFRLSPRPAGLVHQRRIDESDPYLSARPSRRQRVRRSSHRHRQERGVGNPDDRGPRAPRLPGIDDQPRRQADDHHAAARSAPA